MVSLGWDTDGREYTDGSSITDIERLRGSSNVGKRQRKAKRVINHQLKVKVSKSEDLLAIR